MHLPGLLVFLVSSVGYVGVFCQPPYLLKSNGRCKDKNEVMKKICAKEIQPTCSHPRIVDRQCFERRKKCVCKKGYVRGEDYQLTDQVSGSCFKLSLCHEYNTGGDEDDNPIIYDAGNLPVSDDDIDGGKDDPDNPNYYKRPLVNSDIDGGPDDPDNPNYHKRPLVNSDIDGGPDDPDNPNYHKKPLVNSDIDGGPDDPDSPDYYSDAPAQKLKLVMYPI